MFRRLDKQNISGRNMRSYMTPFELYKAHLCSNMTNRSQGLARGNYRLIKSKMIIL